jgi:hypothetical protein
MQGDAGNSDVNAPAVSHRSENFSALDSRENFIRPD